MFRIGQKVVCVDDAPGLITGTKELVLGSIYIICGFDTEDPRFVNLYLEGVPARYVAYLSG